MTASSLPIRHFGRCFRWYSGQRFSAHRAAHLAFRGGYPAPPGARSRYPNPLDPLLSGDFAFLRHGEKGPRHIIEAAFALLGIVARGTGYELRGAFQDLRERLEEEGSFFSPRYRLRELDGGQARTKMLEVLEHFSRSPAAEGDSEGVIRLEPLFEPFSEYPPEVRSEGKLLTSTELHLPLDAPMGKGLLICDAPVETIVVGHFRSGYALAQVRGFAG